MVDATGPNTSTRCGVLERSDARNSVGSTNAPRSGFASTSARGSPRNVTSQSADSAAMPSSTAPRCAGFASGPMVTVAFTGSPTMTRASSAPTASSTTACISRGTRTRLMAVHFWPAFEVISRTISWQRRVNAGVPTRCPGPRMAALTLPVSRLSRAPRENAACARSRSAVVADPVNATTSPMPT